MYIVLLPLIICLMFFFTGSEAYAQTSQICYTYTVRASSDGEIPPKPKKPIDPRTTESAFCVDGAGTYDLKAEPGEYKIFKFLFAARNSYGWSELTEREYRLDLRASSIIEAPEFIHAPILSSSGNFLVKWGETTTKDATYILEISSDHDFAQSTEIYSGHELQALVSDLKGGIYFFRVRAESDSGKTSPWLVLHNECLVDLFSSVSIYPPRHNSTNFGDVIVPDDDIKWLRLWTGKHDDQKELAGRYVNTSSFNEYGHGWIESERLHELLFDYAQTHDTILYVLPWRPGKELEWLKSDVVFNDSEQVDSSIRSPLDDNPSLSDIITVHNNEHGEHWFRLWLGDVKTGHYVDTSSLNQYGHGWVEHVDMEKVLIDFSDTRELWIQEFSKNVKSQKYINYGWKKIVFSY